MADEEWLTVEQIAERLQVEPQTVRRWLRAGKLRGVNFSGRTGYRVRREDYEAFTTDRLIAAHRPRGAKEEKEEGE